MSKRHRSNSKIIRFLTGGVRVTGEVSQDIKPGDPRYVKGGPEKYVAVRRKLKIDPNFVNALANRQSYVPEEENVVREDLPAFEPYPIQVPTPLVKSVASMPLAKNVPIFQGQSMQYQPLERRNIVDELKVYREGLDQIKLICPMLKDYEQSMPQQEEFVPFVPEPPPAPVFEPTILSKDIRSMPQEEPMQEFEPSLTPSLIMPTSEQIRSEARSLVSQMFQSKKPTTQIKLLTKEGKSNPTDYKYTYGIIPTLSIEKKCATSKLMKESLRKIKKADELVSKIPIHIPPPSLCLSQSLRNIERANRLVRNMPKHIPPPSRIGLSLDKRIDRFLTL